MGKGNERIRLSHPSKKPPDGRADPAKTNDLDRCSPALDPFPAGSVGCRQKKGRSGIGPGEGFHAPGGK